MVADFDDLFDTVLTRLVYFWAVIATLKEKKDPTGNRPAAHQDSLRRGQPHASTP